MPRPGTTFFSFAALLATAAPLAVIWTAQNRVAEDLRLSSRLEANTPAFNGFPYLRVPQDELKGPHAVNAFEEIVHKQTAELGPTHPDTLVSRNNLSNALLADERYGEAEAAQRELLADMERSLPAEHPDIFRCRFNLALNLRLQGKLSEARSEMEAVYAGCVNSLGKTHPRTQVALLVLENLRRPL
jgi:hypothetical protein